MRFIFLCMLALTINQTYAISNPYRGGEVGILIKNDRPCFYISDPKEDGSYSIATLKFSSQQKVEWRYLGNFKKDNLTKDNCIIWEQQSSISNNQYIIMNTPYSVTLGTKEKAYSTNFCLTQKDGVTVLQKVRGTECYDPPKSKWQSFKGLFH